MSGLNKYRKSDKASFIICADFECLIEKIDGCEKNSENLSTTKVSENLPSGFPMSMVSSFRSIENKHHVYIGKDCMKHFCELLRKHVMKITNFEKKIMKLLTKEQQKSYENAKICYICKKKYKMNILKMKNIVKLETISIMEWNIEVLHIAYVN